MTAATNLLSLVGVQKRFGETRALVDACLEAVAGEVHAVVGENGSGKSTLAKIVSGVLTAGTGVVRVCGVCPTTPRAAIDAGVATIYQEMMLAEELSVLDNLYAGVDGFWRRREPLATRRRVAAELLERLVAAPLDPDTRVGDLPLGIRQWVVIARALLRKPKLLIFDESSAALDLDATERLHREIQALKSRGTCVLLVTHRIAELVRIADRATVLRDGATVGRLDRHEITEARLLELMSASVQAGGERRTRHVAHPSRKPLLAMHDATLQGGSAPVDFRIDTGEIVGVAGLDGAGQDVFVRALAGIRPPLAGRVELTDSVSGVHDVDSVEQAEAAGITYVSGDRRREGLFPNLSIVENFGLALMDRHTGRAGIIDRDARQGDFDRAAERLRLRFGDARDRITTLSGGNQQKVLIARAFARGPRVIVLNDPARGVDIGTKRELYAHLREFASSGGAVVYLSSEIEEFFGFADRVDVFAGGTLFDTLRDDGIDEGPLLAAMFGTRPGVDDVGRVGADRVGEALGR